MRRTGRRLGHGGIEAVVRAMAAHGSSEEVQENGCSALINLSFNPRNQVAIGVPLVTKGLICVPI